MLTRKVIPAFGALAATILLGLPIAYSIPMGFDYAVTAVRTMMGG